MSGSIKNPKREPVDVVAIIPARGGEQSIKYKNLQKLGGKTLLAWAVEVAFAAKRIDAVVVSTEDERIAKEAVGLGAIVVPRPKKYSQPKSSDAGFYTHAVKWLEEKLGWTPELLVNLRPTSPLRFAKDIDRMVDYMRKSKADGLKSVVSAPLHPYKMWQIDSDGVVGSSGKLSPVFDNEFRQERGPDLPRQVVQEKWPVFWQDGQVDITQRKFILRSECLKYDNVWGNNLHGFVLDPRTSTDLDEPEDFIRAEKVYKQMKKERSEK